MHTHNFRGPLRAFLYPKSSALKKRIGFAESKFLSVGINAFDKRIPNVSETVAYPMATWLDPGRLAVHSKRRTFVSKAAISSHEMKAQVNKKLISSMFYIASLSAYSCFED